MNNSFGKWLEGVAELFDVTEIADFASRYARWRPGFCESVHAQPAEALESCNRIIADMKNAEDLFARRGAELRQRRLALEALGINLETRCNADESLRKLLTNLAAGDLPLYPPKAPAKPDIKIDDLDFDNRTYNCLKRQGIETLQELAGYTKEELYEIRNFQQKSMDKVIEMLARYDLALKPTPPAATAEP